PISARLRQEWKGKRLAIVASGALEYVPFAALPLPEMEGQSDGATGRQGDRGTPSRPVAPSPRRPVALIAAHEIVNLPSASARALVRKEGGGRQMPTKTLAALADPVFEVNDPRLAATRKKATSN